MRKKKSMVNGSRLCIKSAAHALFIGLLLVSQACSNAQAPEWLGYTTQKLWESNDPNVRIWIDADKITEDELKQRGVNYTTYSSEKFNGYLVGKSEREKLRGFYLKMLGTPVTLTVDAATIVVVVGVAAGASYLISGDFADHVNAD